MKIRICDKYVKVVVMVAVGMVIGSLICLLFVDEAVFQWLRPESPEIVYNTFVHAFRQFGKPWVPIWLLLIWGWLKKDQRPVVAGLLGLILIAPAIVSIKGALQRPRPMHILNRQIDDYSKPEWLESWAYPSGDTATVFVVATTSCAFVKHISLRVLIFLTAGGVGIFRVFSLHHFPSDVFGGAAVGIFLGVLALYITRKLFRADPGQHPYFANDYSLIFIFALPVIVAVFEDYNPLMIFISVYGPIVFLLVAAVLAKQRRIPFVKN